MMRVCSFWMADPRMALTAVLAAAVNERNQQIIRETETVFTTITSAVELISASKMNITQPTDFWPHMWKNSSETAFKETFRMSKSSFQILHDMIDWLSIFPRSGHFGTDFKLALFLYYLAHQTSSRNMRSVFGIGQPTIVKY